jgi:hypothetical protein
MRAAAAVERGCGRRKQGAIYFECGLGPVGRPVDDFLIDPPERLGEFDVTPVGVQLIERAGTYHVIDWVGSESYPNVADFVEEVRRFGLSRRAAKVLPFQLISPASRIILVHERAWIDNWSEYREPVDARGDRAHICPKGILCHMTAQVGPCAGLWWEDVVEAIPSSMIPGGAIRQMPSFEYNCRPRPMKLVDLSGVAVPLEEKYEPAFFASFPISRIAVVKAPDGGHAEALAKARTCTRLPVEETDA